jgi:hypothetical protein
MELFSLVKDYQNNAKISKNNDKSYLNSDFENLFLLIISNI